MATPYPKETVLTEPLSDAWLISILARAAHLRGRKSGPAPLAMGTNESAFKYGAGR